MNKIVRENYPASNLPEDLRPSSDPDARVRVTIEDAPIDTEKKSEQVMTLEEIFSLTGFRRRTKEEIDEDVRRDRDEWDH
ncbi:hypothetical protein [Rhodoplanes roseus]|uniref:Uncharacterized protein n=1 Tax=Rhodoplanes roseus TaxID=29409 RepID=A0A327KWF9_9BRAD|nr:hypothetical protein [Rhodoplanes roseus]RAI43240.1 hypothetical protein CH341_15450 [Rhodoplanes roseus]